MQHHDARADELAKELETLHRAYVTTEGESAATAREREKLEAKVKRLSDEVMTGQVVERRLRLRLQETTKELDEVRRDKDVTRSSKERLNAHLAETKEKLRLMERRAVVSAPC